MLNSVLVFFNYASKSLDSNKASKFWDQVHPQWSESQLPRMCCTNVQMYTSTNIQIYKYTKIQMYK